MSLIKFQDVTIFWENLYKRNEMSGKYQVELAGLNPAQVEKLEDLGVPVHNKGDDRGDYCSAKSSNYPINAYDTEGNEIKEVSVGNGSKATIVFGTYDWKNPAGKKGTSMSIKKLIVTDLVPYGGSVEEIEDVESMVDEVL